MPPDGVLLPLEWRDIGLSVSENEKKIYSSSFPTSSLPWSQSSNKSACSNLLIQTTWLVERVEQRTFTFENKTTELTCLPFFCRLRSSFARILFNNNIILLWRDEIWNRSTNDVRYSILIYLGNCRRTSKLRIQFAVKQKYS